MSITDSELALVQASFDRLRNDLDTHSAAFYEALFRHAPELRSMFRDDLAGQGMKFMTTLDAIIQKLDDEEDAIEQFVGLGATHRSLGVERAHFDVMEEALIDTLREALGDAFTAELEQAWRKAYEIVSANMIRRGAIKG